MGQEAESREADQGGARGKSDLEGTGLVYGKPANTPQNKRIPQMNASVCYLRPQ